MKSYVQEDRQTARRQEILKYITRAGAAGTDSAEIAARFRVSRTTAARDIKSLGAAVRTEQKGCYPMKVLPLQCTRCPRFSSDFPECPDIDCPHGR